MSSFFGSLWQQMAESLLEDPGLIQLTSDENNLEATVNRMKNLPCYQNSLSELKSRMQSLLASADEDQVLHLARSLGSVHEAGFTHEQPLTDSSSRQTTNPTTNLRVNASKDRNPRTLCRNRRAISPAESTTSSSSAASSLTLCARPVKQSAKSSEVRRDARTIDPLDHAVPIQFAIPIQPGRGQQATKPQPEHSVKPSGQAFSDADSSFSSCLNQEGFALLNQDQLISLANGLDRCHSSLTNRQQALRQLVRLPLSDIQASEAWLNIADSEMPVSTTSWADLTAPKGSMTLGNRSTSFVNVSGLRGNSKVSRHDKSRHSVDYRPLKPTREGSGLKQGLTDALNDEDDTLWSLSLRYICKGLSTSPPNIRESYRMLVNHLQWLFTTNVERIPALCEPVNMALHPMDRALRTCHLLNQFHRTVCQFWIRYPEKFLDELIEQTLDILTLNCNEWSASGGVGRLTPLCVISLLDPHAEWFTKWMHGSYSRDPLIHHLRKEPSLVNCSLDIILNFMRSTQLCVPRVKTRPSTAGNNPLVFSAEEILASLFLHSVSIIHRLLRYSRGRKLFTGSSGSTSGQCSTRNISARDVICAMLEYLNTKQHFSIETHSSTHPTEVIVSCLVDLAQLPGCYTELFGDYPDSDEKKSNACKSNPVDLLLTGLVAFSEYQTDGDSLDRLDETELHRLENQLRILESLVSHHAGRKLLHTTRCGSNGKSWQPMTFLNRTTEQLVELLTISKQAVVTSKENRLASISRLLFMLLKIICALNTLSSSEQLGDVDHYCATLIRIHHELKFMDTQSKKSSEPHENGPSLLQRFCMQLLEYPTGVIHVERAGLINECAQTLCDWLGESNLFPEPRSLGRILTNLSFTKNGIQALSPVGLINTLVNDLWRAVEIGEHAPVIGRPTNWDPSLCVSRVPTWSVDPIDPAVYKPFIRLVRATCSYMGIASLLEDAEGNNVSAVRGRRFAPTNLKEFFQRTIIEPKDNSQSHALYNREETTVLALRLLACMLSDLNTMLLFECQFKLTSQLLRVQQEAVTSNGHVQLDALTVERNYILVKCTTIGGPDERILPPRFICEHNPNPYPYPMLTSEMDTKTPHAFDKLYDGYSPISPCTKNPCSSWYTQLYPPTSIAHKPNVYSALSSSVFRTNEGFSKAITSRACAEEWIQCCRDSLLSVERTKQPFPVKFTEDEFGIFLENWSKCSTLLREETEQTLQPIAACTDSEASDSVKLSEQDVLGVKLTVRYGQRLGLLESVSPSDVTKSPHVTNLTDLLKRIKWGFRQLILKSNPDGDAGRAQDAYFGFDWFVATIFIGLRGNSTSCWTFLSRFAADPRSVYLWPIRGQYLLLEQNDSCLDAFRLRSCQFLEHLLALECPNVSNTFLLVELPASQIFSRWTTNCFWNYLNWNQIMDRIIVCLLNPPSWQVYFGVTVLRHLSEAISRSSVERPTEQQHQPEQLIVFLQEEPIRGFDTQHHLPYMNYLHNKYGEQLDRLLTTIAFS